LLKAYVLITTDYGCQQEVYNKLISIPEVKEAYKLHGIYDLIVNIEADDIKNLKEIIHHRIRGLYKVRSALTMIERIEENKIRGKYFVYNKILVPMDARALFYSNVYLVVGGAKCARAR
jgi:DNA-binding Lrp family transcriptional regulator